MKQRHLDVGFKKTKIKKKYIVMTWPHNNIPAQNEVLKTIPASWVEQTLLWPVESENHGDSSSAAQRGKFTSEFKT